MPENSNGYPYRSAMEERAEALSLAVESRKDPRCDDSLWDLYKKFLCEMRFGKVDKEEVGLPFDMTEEINAQNKGQ